MDLEKKYKFYLKIYFLLVCFGLFLHTIWHFTIPRFPEMQGVTEIQLNFIKLLNLGIVLTFSFFAVITYKIIYSDLFNLTQIRFINFLMIGFWAGRFILELIFPVKVPLLYTQYSSDIFKVLLLIGLILLCTPEIIFQRSKNI
jgi:hypothetical protein